MFVSLLLSIQKVNGGGRPGGGLQGRTSGEPSVTSTGSSTSLGHRGASGGYGKGERNINENISMIGNTIFVKTLYH